MERWIAALPEGARVSWSEDTIPVESRVTRGFLDVRVPELCREASLGWVWGVEGPDLNDPGEGPLTITLDYDAEVEFTVRAGELVRASVVRPDGSKTEIPPGEVAHWMGRAHPHAMDGEDQLSRVAVWTPEAVSGAISRWCAERAGRPDLEIVWDDDAEPSPLVRALEQVAADLERDGLPEEAVMIGEGVYALPDAFDELLAMDPQDAAQITGALSDEARRSA